MAAVGSGKPPGSKEGSRKSGNGSLQGAFAYFEQLLHDNRRRHP